MVGRNKRGGIMISQSTVSGSAARGDSEQIGRGEGVQAEL